MPTATTTPFTREPTLFELVARLALGAAPRQLALTGVFQVAAAALLLWRLPAQWALALPMLAFAAASAWGLAAHADRAEDSHVRAFALTVVRGAAAAAGFAALVGFALSFFLGALGTSWMS